MAIFRWLICAWLLLRLIAIGAPLNEVEDV
jgi:hypothetical protein